MTKLIKMVREGPEPRCADVHPAEVENFRAAGFEVEGGASPSAPDLDPVSVFDPRVETVEEFEARRSEPLDHDGDGGKGGSVKGYHSTAAKGARKRKAKKGGR